MDESKVTAIFSIRDANSLLDELGVDEEKAPLKINAHALLCIDKDIYKTSKDMETLIGILKLISESASHAFNSPNDFGI